MYDVPGIMLTLRHPEFELLASQDGLLLFGREPPPGQALEQTFRLREGDGEQRAPLFRFTPHIGLLSARIEPLENRRVRLYYEWVALQPLDKLQPMFAVSRLEGVDHSRIVHLPTLALHPTPSWQPGRIIEEEFEVVLPAELAPGSYRLLTGWYDGTDLDAAATDSRSRVGEEFLLGTIVLP
jgi:hypothetical protein